MAVKTHQQIDLFDAPAEFCHMDPGELRPSRPSTDPPLDVQFRESVRKCGVVTPVLVALEPDGTRTLLAGVRRVIAAQETGQLVPVRTVQGSPATLFIRAFNEDYHNRRRSTVERGWQVSEIVAAAVAEGIEVSRRWLASELGVSVGTAQTWMKLGEQLPRSRLVQLAMELDADPARIQALGLRPALRVANAADDNEAVEVLRELLWKEPSSDLPVRFWVRLWKMLRSAAHWLLGNIWHGNSQWEPFSGKSE